MIIGRKYLTLFWGTLSLSPVQSWYHAGLLMQYHHSTIVGIASLADITAQVSSLCHSARIYIAPARTLTSFRIDVTPIFDGWQKLMKSKTIVKAASRYSWTVLKVYIGRKLPYSTVFCYLADRERDKSGRTQGGASFCQPISVAKTGVTLILNEVRVRAGAMYTVQMVKR